MIGYQADGGPTWWGNLYDESRRRITLIEADTALIGRILKPNDWNDYEVYANDDHIRLSINGETTCRLPRRRCVDCARRRHCAANPFGSAARSALQGHSNQEAVAPDNFAGSRNANRDQGLSVAGESPGPGNGVLRPPPVSPSSRASRVLVGIDNQPLCWPASPPVSAVGP